jgi:hypothetical protein
MVKHDLYKSKGANIPLDFLIIAPHHSEQLNPTHMDNEEI